MVRQWNYRKKEKDINRSKKHSNKVDETFTLRGLYHITHHEPNAKAESAALVYCELREQTK